MSSINTTSGYIAFKYTSSGTGSGSAALWELDNIILTGIQSSGGNTLPVFTSTPITSATAGQTYTYNIIASDADGDALIITAPVKPNWLSITDNGNGTAVLTGTPQNSDAGDNLVSINVYDGIENINQDFTIVVTSTVLVNLSLKQNLKIYPNPAKNIITLTSLTEIKSIEMFNILGKRIYENSNINSKKYAWNLETFSKGIYFIKIKTINNQTDLKKLIIE